MFETQHDDAGDGHIIHTTLSFADAQDRSIHHAGATLKVTIGNVDLPAFVSDGKLYVQASLGLLFEAFAENLSEFLRDMEVRVSTARGATLSLDRDGRPVHGAGMAESSVVSDRGIER